MCYCMLILHAEALFVMYAITLKWLKSMYICLYVYRDRLLLVELHPLKIHMVKSSTPPPPRTLLGNRVVADIIS